MPVERIAIIATPDGTPIAFGSRAGNEHWVSVPKCASFRFEPGCSVVEVHPDPDVDDERVLDAYLGAALPMVVQTVLEHQALHASAIVTPSGAVVAFCGSTHAGKTTLAYGLSRRGYSIWADDALAFDAAIANAVLALRLPFRLNVRDQTAAHFGAVAEDASYVDDEFGEGTRAPLIVVFELERVERGEPWRRPIAHRLSPAEALLALLAHSFRFQPQTPDEERRMLVDYLELAARVPVFRLRVPAELDELDELLDEVETTIPAVAP
jgi:hypothetical protein